MFQRTTLIGRVGKDPEMRYTPSGTPVTNFSLATTQESPKTTREGGQRPCPEGWKESYNGKRWELTTWWRITAWGSLAEFTNEYITSGAILFVEGEINGEARDGSQNPRIWTTRDGEARASFELTARLIKITKWGDAREESPNPPQEGDNGWVPDYDW